MTNIEMPSIRAIFRIFTAPFSRRSRRAEVADAPADVFLAQGGHGPPRYQLELTTRQP